MIILLIVGIVLFIFSFLSVFSKRFFENSVRPLGGPIVDDAVFSKKNSYFIRRYFAGYQGMLAGLGCIVLYLLLNPPTFDVVASWFHAVL
jgi:hypothetical protein